MFLPLHIAFQTDAEARSVIAEWNYQTETCLGSALSSDWRFTFGGAYLLATNQSYDQSLIRLRRDPPGGTGYSGWWATDVSRDAEGVGAHHPGSDRKKFFAGTVLGNFDVNICDDDDNCTLLIDSIEIDMTEGASESGSSGAGLQINHPRDNKPRLVGVLAGSDDKCHRGLTNFGELRHFYPDIQTWFNPPAPNDDGDDHGNTTATATIIPATSTTNGEIETGNDVDYFEVSVTKRGTIKVYTTGDLDTIGTFTSESGDLEVEDDDDGESTNFSLSTDVTPGTYHIKVESYLNYTGDYTFHVEFEENDDHGDTFAIATTLTSNALSWGFTTVGNIEVDTDKDVFEIKLEHNSTVTIYTEGSTDTSGVLASYSGNTLLENEDVNDNDSNFRLRGALRTGFYYLTVEGDVTEKSEYKLIVDVEQ